MVVTLPSWGILTPARSEGQEWSVSTLLHRQEADSEGPGDGALGHSWPAGWQDAGLESRPLPARPTEAFTRALPGSCSCVPLGTVGLGESMDCKEAKTSIICV